MRDQSVGKSLRDVCQDAGDPDLLGRGTILEIVVTYTSGRISRTVRIASIPCAAKSSASAARNASLSLLGAPFGRPAGLPD